MKLSKYNYTFCCYQSCKRIATSSEPGKGNKNATFCKKHRNI